jgi:hypothetical protein
MDRDKVRDRTCQHSEGGGLPCAIDTQEAEALPTGHAEPHWSYCIYRWLPHSLAVRLFYPVQQYMERPRVGATS